MRFCQYEKAPYIKSAFMQNAICANLGYYPFNLLLAINADAKFV